VKGPSRLSYRSTSAPPRDGAPAGHRPWPVVRLLLLAVVAGTAAADARAAEPGATIIEYGRYETERSGEVLKKPGTASGAVTPVHTRRHMERTDRIFGQLDRSFGIEVDLRNMPPGPVPLTIRTLHPPLTNPDTGRTTDVSEYDWTVISREKLYFGFTFDHRWEIAEGRWTKQILHDGKVIAEKTFMVMVPLN